MAEEVVKIIKIETGGSEQTVKGLKEEINSLRDALLNTEKGSQEYDDILEQLIKDQEKLTDAMRAGQKGAKAAEGSYNALVNQMAALRKEWRETTDEVTREKLGKQIEEINTKLKGMDGSLGDYRRNVGNYSQSITAAFSSMGGAAKGMIGPLNGVKTAMTGISSHPIVAALTALAALLIGGIAKGFKSSEENTNKLRVAFSGLQAIADAITKVFQKLAGWIGDVANAIVGLAEKIGFFDTKVGKKFSERMELMKKQIALEKQERDSIVKTAKIESEAAELRAKASDEENYSITQRIDFLRQAQAKEEENLQLEKQILEQKVSILEAQLALTDSTAEELTKLEELKAQVIKVNTQIAANQRSYNKEINALRKRSLSEAVAARTEYLNLQKSLIEQEYNNAAEGSEKQLQLAKDLRKKELEIQQEGFKTKIKNRNDYNKAMQLSIQAYNQDIENLEVGAVNSIIARQRELSNRRLNLLRTNSVEYYEELKKTEEKVHNLYRAIIEANGDLSKVQDMGLFEGFSEEFISTLSDKNIEAFKTLESESLKALKDISDNLTKAEDEQVRMVNQIILDGIRPMSAYYSEQAKQLKKEYEDMTQYFDESDEQFASRRKAVWKEYTDALINEYQAVSSEFRIMDNIQGDLNYNLFTDWLRGSAYELEQGLETAKEQLSLAFIRLAQYVMADMDNVKATLMNKYEQGTLFLYGLEPTEETITAIITKNKDALRQIFEELGVKTEEEIESFLSDESNINSLYHQLFKSLAVDGLVPQEILDGYLDNLHGMVDAEKSILKERYDNWNSLASGIGSLMGSVADIYEEDLKAQVEHGKKSQEEAEKEFETIKGLRIAVAVIDTIQGALAAFMGWQDKGQPWGAIIGAVQAAAITAAGIAEIAKISNTKFGGSSSGSVGGSTMMAQVSPVMTDYNPDQVGVMTGQQEAEEFANAITSKPIRAYVVESDITNAQQTASQRESESTF